MKELINRTDIHGVQLQEGDIVAECKVGQHIWDDKGIILTRPLGIVVVYKNVKKHASFPVEETDFYNIKSIRCGTVQLTDKADKWMKNDSINNNDNNIIDLYISTWDGNFYGWDNIEKICSIYDLCK